MNNKEDLVSIQNISIETNKNPVKEPVSSKDLNSENSSNIPKTQKRKTPSKYVAKPNYIENSPQILEPTQVSLKASKKNTPNSQSNYNRDYQKTNNYSNYKSNYQSTISQSNNFNPNDFVKKTPKKANSIKKNNQITNYLEEVSNQLANELTPKTIELTDYEKIQEEQAIISYQELLSLKDKSQDNNNETNDYLEDLKEFRKLLD